MNFLAHAEAVRLLPGCSTELTLGAMLPDLIGMPGLRVRPDELPAALAAGWACHIATDRTFHADQRFLSAIKEMAGSLVASGWQRWHARGAAHVAWELLLDGHLAQEADPTPWYGPALRCDAFTDHLGAGARADWLRFVELQEQRPLWRSYLEPAGVADRTWRRLNFTRLAFGEDAVPQLTEVLGREVEVVAAAAAGILAAASASAAAVVGGGNGAGPRHGTR